MTEHYCEVHDWTEIGIVVVNSGTIAIVDPCNDDLLASAWDQRITRLRQESLGNFEQLLRGGLVVNTGGDGSWVIEARFDDAYGDGHLSVCELRIRLHDHSDDQAEVEP